MTVKKIFTLCALLVAGALAASNPNYVTALRTPDVTVSAAKPATVTMNFRVASGYHINSNHPQSDLLIPTELKLQAPAELRIAEPSFPAGKDFALSFDPQEKLSVYSGDFAVAARVRPAPSTAPGAYRVHGELSYQACNDRACFPPQKIPVSFDVTIQK
ncbi:MAG: protein-disulfide reductase DsbD domain-containing protein [Candidatus Acidiferrum sp.]